MAIPTHACNISTLRTLPVPAYAQRVITALEHAGYECWVAGGFVRDCLLNRPFCDIDIATNAHWHTTKKLLEAAHIHVFETGVKHGTLTAVVDGAAVEITTFRQEVGYSDHRHPDTVVFVTSITSDCARRDFTINALAWRKQDGLVDCFGGVRDLNARLVRCVGDPHTRFSEDPLRLVRALRFSATYAFRIEEATFAALCSDIHDIAYVAPQRIAQEVKKLVACDRFAYALLCYPSCFAVCLSALFRDVQAAPLTCSQVEYIAACCSLYVVLSETKGNLSCYVAIWQRALARMNLVHSHSFSRMCAQLSYPKNTMRRASLCVAVVDALEALCGQLAASLCVSHSDVVARVQLCLFDMSPRITHTSRAYLLSCAYDAVHLLEAEHAAARLTGRSSDTCALQPPSLQLPHAVFEKIRCALREICTTRAPLCFTDLAISTHDLMCVGIVGARIRDVQRMLFCDVCRGTIPNTHDALCTRARELS